MNSDQATESHELGENDPTVSTTELEDTEGSDAIAEAAADISSQKRRDFNISDAFNRYLDVWSRGPPAELANMVLGIVETYARVEDGTRNMDIKLTEIDPEVFLKQLLESHGRQDPDYQWIFDRFWVNGIISLAQLAKIVDDYCSEIEPLLKRFIEEKAPLESWTPKEGTKYREFLRALNIPDLHGGPDMLLHDLGSFAHHPELQKRVENIFPIGEDNHVVVLNTSGSGKTRLTFEGLCQFWGLYFTSCVDTQGHGSADLQNVMDRIEDEKGFTKNLPLTDFATAHLANRQIARGYLTDVLYARLAILAKFCQIAMQLNSGTLLDEHKKYWLILQLKPSHLAHKDWDIFNELSKRIHGFKWKDSKVITRLAAEVRALTGPGFGARSALFCVIDEAQAAAEKYTGAFRSLKLDSSNARSLLRELVAVWGLVMGMWLILAGTGMKKSVMDETLASAILKEGSVVTAFDIGGFDDATDQMEYMKSLMPDDFKCSEKAQNLFRLAHYWLRGRFRFTATFMRVLLLAGFQDAELLLQQYVSVCTAPPLSDPNAALALQNTGFVPTGGNLNAWVVQTSKRTVGGFKTFSFERLKQNSKLFNDIKICISKFHLRSDISSLHLTNSEYEAVEYGFARVVAVEDQKKAYVVEGQRPTRVILNEPLVVLALMQWLRERDLSVHEGLSLRARTGVTEANGSNGLEEYFAFYFSTVFDDDTPLNKIFRFKKGEPKWAKKPAKLISLYRRDAEWDSLRDQNSEPESGRVLRGSRPSVALGIGGDRAVAQGWLQHNIETPFLFPDTNFGPDILFVLELESKSRIWVAVQSKYSSASLLRKSVLEDALRSIAPSRFYLGKPKGEPETWEATQHNETVSRLKELPNRLKYVPERPNDGAGEYSLLRVVAGWPAKIKLHDREILEKTKARVKKKKTKGEAKDKGNAKRTVKGKKKAEEAPLFGFAFYKDPGNHPLVELDMDFMAKKVKMLHPRDASDPTDSSWLDYPSAPPPNLKRQRGYALYSEEPAPKRVRLDSRDEDEEGFVPPPSSTQEDAEMSELSDSSDLPELSDNLDEAADASSEDEEPDAGAEDSDASPEDAVTRSFQGRYQTRARTKSINASRK
ncbi:hypothetical protein DFH07DRAFT_950077 [Mycena maculata]|uniref:Uncharacterized protein n=1 Tax=Mycena maculata TaxID=230809 RepID=A0AAD7KB11_9AGAR|nr:hypothetical protein DFH07DRAFT_950077 [Mycena maculata]